MSLITLVVSRKKPPAPKYLVEHLLIVPLFSASSTKYLKKKKNIQLYRAFNQRQYLLSSAIFKMGIPEAESAPHTHEMY